MSSLAPDDVQGDRLWLAEIRRMAGVSGAYVALGVAIDASHRAAVESGPESPAALEALYNVRLAAGMVSDEAAKLAGGAS